MKAAEFDQTSIKVSAGPYMLSGTGSVMRFDGYMRLYAELQDTEADEGVLPDLQQGELLTMRGVTIDQHFTQPPPRFNESSLIKELEERGIGRPSTYAAIISTIVDKRYVHLDQGRFFPTELGELVNRLLVESFPDLLNVEFTAAMEALLDSIEEGKKDWIEVLTEFYDPFQEDLRRAMSAMTDIRRQGTPTDISCDRCGSPMVIRFGGKDPFLACSGYPRCKNSKEFSRDDQGRIKPVEEAAIEETCPLCQKPMQKKYGRFGPFLACSGYPECENTKPLSSSAGGQENNDTVTGQSCDKCGGRLIIKRSRIGSRFLACENYPKCKGAKPYSSGVACDQCESGEFVERASRRGKIFYSCSNYPRCKNTLQYKPVPGPCSECGAQYLLEKINRQGIKTLFCKKQKKSFPSN
jgi:DNA topoisomerase-1